MSDDLTSSVKCVRTTHLTDDFKGLVIIYREGGELVQIGGGPPFFMHGLKGRPLKNMQTFCQQKC